MMSDETIVIRELDRRDYRRAQDFAAVGMHFSRFVTGKAALRAYARSFWYEELNKATKAYGAYVGERFVGAMLVSMDGRPRPYRRWWQTAGGHVVGWISRLVERDGADSYDKANAEMLAELRKRETPDGEIGFLAADPAGQVKGVGTALLRALERDEPGKLIFLYTDDTCTYQFYDHRGFERFAERDIEEGPKSCRFTLRCFLYVKRMPGAEARPADAARAQV